MFHDVRILLEAVVIVLVTTTSAPADVPLSQAIDTAIQGKWAKEKTESVTLNGHGFYIRPMTITREQNSLTAEGFFRHRHRGKDDRIHFKIVAAKGQPYTATITKIEYRGFLNNDTVKFGVSAAGAAKGGPAGAAAANAILKALEKLKLQRHFDGKWEPEAAKIVDALGATLAKGV